MWFQESEETKPDIAMPVNYHHTESSDSFPRFHTDSSVSDGVPSPEFHKEVQSQPRWTELGNELDFQFDSLEKFLDESLAQQGGFQSQIDQDVFMYSDELF